MILDGEEYSPCHLLTFGVEIPGYLLYWAQPSGVGFCCFFTVDGGVFRGSFGRSGMVMSG